MKVPHHVLLQIHEGLIAGKAAASKIYEDEILGGKYSRERHMAYFAASEALIAFDVYIAKQITVLELEVTA